MKPTPQEINDLLLKHAGWHKVNRIGPVSGWDNYQWQYKEDKSTWANKPPNYLEDLNALHALENEVLDADITSPSSPKYAYSRCLYDLCPKDTQPFRAAAPLRAEALARVLYPEKFMEINARFYEWISINYGTDVMAAVKTHMEVIKSENSEDAINYLEDILQATRSVDLSKNPIRAKFAY